MGRRIDIDAPAAVRDELEAGRQARHLGRHLTLAAVVPLDAPQFLDEPGVARRLAAVRSEPDTFRRLALLQALGDERRAWAAERGHDLGAPPALASVPRPQRRALSGRTPGPTKGPRDAVER